MKISDIPWYDRPASRLRKYKAEVTDAELLSIILGKVYSESSVPSQNVNRNF